MLGSKALSMRRILRLCRSKRTLLRIVKEIMRESSESRGHRDLKTWTTGMEIKKAYHERLYGDIKAPEPLALVIIM